MRKIISFQKKTKKKNIEKLIKFFDYLTKPKNEITINRIKNDYI